MLITTDLGGRGSDIAALQTVINEDDNCHDDEDNQGPMTCGMECEQRW
jgi:hypothetical protein